MLRKLTLALVVVLAVGAAGLYFWADNVLRSDPVRRAISGQLSRAIGQPVSIGSIGASLLPLAVTLSDVAVGTPPRIVAARVSVRMSLRALLSRRIDNASAEVTGARIQLPLPVFALDTSAGAADSAAPLAIASVDAISVPGFEVVSGGRTLSGDLDMSLAGGETATIRRLSLDADGVSLEASGTISELSGPKGELAVEADALDMVALLAFMSDFAAGAGTAGASAGAAEPPPAADPTPMDVAVQLRAERATFGDLVLDELEGRAQVTPAAVTIEPVTFGVFGGSYDGRLNLSMAGARSFQMKARVSGVDMARVMAFAGSPDTMTGTLAATFDLSAPLGATAADVMSTAGGTARVDVADGSIRNLGLVRTIVLAGSTRADSQAEAARSIEPTEPFTSLGATLAIASGWATTRDLQLTSRNMTVDATGRVGLVNRGLDLEGRVQLSPELSQQAGRDLLRYTAEDGRVTLPVVISGTIDAPNVTIDFAEAAGRAIRNRAIEEAEDAIRRGIGSLLGQ